MAKRGLWWIGASVLCFLMYATTAKAEVQNVKVSGDVTVRGVYRTNYDLQREYMDAVTGRDNKSFLMSTVRLKLDADLTDNVSATVRIINERDWDQDSTASDDIDMDLAYITLREINYWPVTLTIGRQELRYGNLLVIGDGDLNSNALTGLTAKDLSARKAFDAIKAVFDLSPLTLDVFTAKIDEDTSTGSTSSDTDLYGVNARYEFPDYDAIGEAYYFSKKVGGTDHKRIDTVGIRGKLTPAENLTLNAEIAHQFGEYVAERDMSADAIQLGVDYAMVEYLYSPTIGLWYTYLSGQKAGEGGNQHNWDSMYSDQVCGEIVSALGLASKNVHIVNVKGSIKPVDKLTLSLDYYYFATAEKYAAGNHTFLGTNLTSYTYTLEGDKDYLGNEIDLRLAYDYTEDVQFGLLAAWFIPGSAFAEVNHNTAKEVIGSVKVTF